MDSPHIKLTIYPDTEFGIIPDVSKGRISARSSKFFQNRTDISDVQLNIGTFIPVPIG